MLYKKIIRNYISKIHLRKRAMSPHLFTVIFFPLLSKDKKCQKLNIIQLIFHNFLKKCQNPKMEENDVVRIGQTPKKKGQRQYWDAAENQDLQDAIRDSPKSKTGKLLFSKEIIPRYIENRNKRLGEGNYFKRSERHIIEHYHNELDPNVNKKPLTQEEINLLKENASELNYKWSSIAKYFVNRTPNFLKNYYNLHIKGKITQVQQYASVQQHEAPVNSEPLQSGDELQLLAGMMNFGDNNIFMDDTNEFQSLIDSLFS